MIQVIIAPPVPVPTVVTRCRRQKGSVRKSLAFSDINLTYCKESLAGGLSDLVTMKIKFQNQKIQNLRRPELPDCITQPDPGFQVFRTYKNIATVNGTPMCQ